MLIIIFFIIFKKIQLKLKVIKDRSTMNLMMNLKSTYICIHC